MASNSLDTTVKIALLRLKPPGIPAGGSFLGAQAGDFEVSGGNGDTLGAVFVLGVVAVFSFVEFFASGVVRVVVVVV